MQQKQTIYWLVSAFTGDLFQLKDNRWEFVEKILKGGVLRKYEEKKAQNRKTTSSETLSKRKTKTNKTRAVHERKLPGSVLNVVERTHLRQLSRVSPNRECSPLHDCDQAHCPLRPLPQNGFHLLTRLLR